MPSKSFSRSAVFGHGLLVAPCALAIWLGAPMWLWIAASASILSSIVISIRRPPTSLVAVALLGLFPVLLIALGLRTPLTRDSLAIFLCVFVLVALSAAWSFKVARLYFPIATRRLKLLAVMISLTLLLLEVSLWSFGKLTGWPLFQAADVSAEQRVAANRRRPYEIRYGFPCNDQGFYDGPFDSPTEPGFRRIACLSDSFGVGVVPHHYNFTTVAERNGSQLRIDNISVVSIGPPEYLHLLKTVAKRWNPDVYLVCLFLGNDITDTRRHPKFRRRRPSILERDDFLLWRIPRRILKIRSGLEPMTDAEGRIEGKDVIVRTPQGESRIQWEERLEGYETLYPWINDQNLEEPTFSEEAYFDLCMEKSTAICGDSPIYGSIKEVLTEIHLACGETPLCVALFPDEFQVDDRLWQKMLLDREGPSWNRDRPQEELIAHLKELAIPYLDFLPIFRREARENPGSRFYKLRDTHFNTLGNKIAGEALSEFLERQLTR